MPTFVRPLKDRKLLSVIEDSEAYDILSTRSRENDEVKGNTNNTCESTTKQPVATENSGNEKQVVDNEVHSNENSKNKEKVLQEEIDNLREEVARWQKVNNKLML